MTNDVAVKELQILKGDMYDAIVCKALDSAISALNEFGKIVHCKDCRHAVMTIDGDAKYCHMWEEQFDDYSSKLYLPGDFYCAFGEKKDD